MVNRICAFCQVKFKKLCSEEKGAQAVEYVALGLLGLAIVMAKSQMGT